MGRGLVRIVVAASVACGAVGIAGCTGDKDSDEGRKIEAVVKRFSLASGREACSLMTAKALATVYGGGSPDPAVGRSRCARASKNFSGQPVTITFVKLNDSDTAHATARTPGGRRYFSVGLEKHRGQWLINTVVPRQRPG